jgi:hypothetical protein
MADPPGYFITEVRRLDDRGDYFCLELGGDTPITLYIVPEACSDLARRLLMGEPKDRDQITLTARQRP